jgi:hypothetical protein
MHDQGLALCRGQRAGLQRPRQGAAGQAVQRRQRRLQAARCRAKASSSRLVGIKGGALAATSAQQLGDDGGLDLPQRT